MPALAFGCFLFSHSGYAQCPEVCDNNQNTGFGVAALPAVNGGTGNTAIGNDALASTTSGRYNTAVGEGALTNNTVDGNTAIGDEAMIRIRPGYAMWQLDNRRWTLARRATTIPRTAISSL